MSSLNIYLLKHTDLHTPKWRSLNEQETSLNDVAGVEGKLGLPEISFGGDATWESPSQMKGKLASRQFIKIP